MNDFAERWLRKRVRIYAACDWRKQYPPMAEGVVVAYADSPTITVRADDGRQSDWLVTLPIDVVAEEQAIPDAAVLVGAEVVRRVESVATQLLGLAERHHSEWLLRGGNAGDADTESARADAYMDAFERLSTAILRCPDHGEPAGACTGCADERQGA